MGTVECPVCFLYLRAGMSLEDHLETHPKDKVIQALVSMAMKKSSGPSISENSSVQTSQSTPAISTPAIQQRQLECPPPSVPFMPRPIITILNTPHQHHNQAQSMKENQTLYSNQGTGSGNTFIDSNGGHHNVMIVKSYSSKYVHQQHPQPQAASSSSVHDNVKRNIFAPRYITLESAPSYPPPPYSTAISSIMSTSQQSNLNSMPAKTTEIYSNQCSTTANSTTTTTTSSSSYHDEEISLVTEIPQNETISDKIITSAQKVMHDDEAEEKGEMEEMEGMVEMDETDNVQEDVIEQTEVIEIENDESANTEEYMFIEEENFEEEVIEIKKEDPDYIPDEKMKSKGFNLIVDQGPSSSRCKKSTTGLKVLSNVKVTTDLSQGIKDIILNLNNKTAAVNQTPIITPTKHSTTKEFIKTVDNQCKNELIINSGNNMPLIDLDKVNDIEIIDDDDENGDEDCYIGSIEVKTSNQTGQQHSSEQIVASEPNIEESVQQSTETEVESILPHNEDKLDIKPEATCAEDLSNSREKSLSPAPVVSSVITSVIRMTPHPPELQTMSTQSSMVTSEANKDMSFEQCDDPTTISKEDNQQQIILDNINSEPCRNWNKDFSYDNPPPLISKPLEQEAPPVYHLAPIFNKQPKKLTVKLKTPLPKLENVATNNAEVIQKEEIIDEPIQLLVPKLEIKCEPSTSSVTITSTSSPPNNGEMENSDSKMEIELMDEKASIKIEKDLSEIVDYAGHNAKVVESNDIRYGEEVFNVKILEADEGEMLMEADEHSSNCLEMDEDNKVGHNQLVSYKYEAEEYNEEDELECARYAKTMTMPTATATLTSSSSSGRVEENFSKFEIDRKDIFEAGPSRSSKYIDYSDEYNNYMQPEQIPLAWVQKFSPQYTPFDDQVSYTDLDMCSKNNSNSAGGASGSNSSHNESIVRATSTDSLNIRTDEQMPAKGEISEQESNGEIELSWNRLYPFPENAPIYPSSYDMSTAQECWNLRRSDTEPVATSSINFQLLGQNADDENFVKVKFEVEEELADPEQDRNKKVKSRTYRCLSCPKTFSTLKQKKTHTTTEHAEVESKLNLLAEAAIPSSAWPSSSTSVYNVPVVSTSYDVSATATTSSSFPYDGACSSQASRSNILLNKKIKQEPVAVLMSYSSLKQELEMKKENPGDTTNEFRIKRSYICGTCKLEFVSFKLFNRHLLIHPAECYTCGRSFKHWPNFTLHIKRHLGIKDHQCSRCDKKFVIRQKLIEHMRIHTGQAPIKCPDCDLYFKRYSNLAQHRNRHHLKKLSPKKDYVCQCGEVFQSKAKLEWHKEIHENRPKSCPYCREKFIHKNSLTRHMRLSHTDKYIKIKLESGTEMCTICHKPYIKTNLKRHMETHTTEKLGYSCAICNKRFSTNWNLKQHKWTHANPTSKPFQCNLCSSAFVREADYIMHMNAHKSIRPYTCNYCGCQFIRKYNWVRHTREHETDKNYTCETCGRKFHRKYYLTEHNRIHTGERPFSCNICGKTSSTKTNHNKHIKIHHARDPLTSEG